MRADQAQSSTVQIQEPALQEINKRSRGWLRGSCVTGGSCIILFFLALYIMFRIVVGSGPNVLSQIPADFPSDIPQFNPDKIIRVTYVDATTKTRAVWVATALPRFMLAPLLGEIDPEARISQTTDSLGRVDFSRNINQSDFVRYLNWPVGKPHTATVAITWSGIKTYPSVLSDSIQRALTQKGYKISEDEHPDTNAADFSFSKDSITGTFRAIDIDPKSSGIEFIELIVNYP